MGGHSAWRKRLKAGLLAKGSGGAICRHRPHLGPKGKEEREQLRKGNINGGPNKKKKKREQTKGLESTNTNETTNQKEMISLIMKHLSNVVLIALFWILVKLALKYSSTE